MEKDRDLRYQTAAGCAGTSGAQSRDSDFGRLAAARGTTAAIPASGAGSVAAEQSGPGVRGAPAGRSRWMPVLGGVIVMLGVGAFAGYQWLTRPRAHEFNLQNMQIYALD